MGLAAVVNAECPDEALDGRQSVQCCAKSLSGYREYWPEDFINSGMCRDSQSWREFQSHIRWPHSVVIIQHLLKQNFC